MKCPRCGHEMSIDNHRRIDMFMCYDCGYIEGRNIDEPVRREHVTNYEKLRTMDLNEAAAFIANGLHIDETALISWMDSQMR